jgi:hypothetical protein
MKGEQWPIYQRVLQEARARGLRFALGGAFAVATYTGLWRNTKDLDIYVLPEDREAMIELLNQLGLTDYYDTLPYDRRWIYRSHSNGVIVDIIWAMANRRAYVDETWLSAGVDVDVGGEVVRVLPAEEVIWNKLYVLQRDRCDWPDCLNLVYSAGPDLDWCRLLDRLGEDASLLAGMLAVFAWISPGRARTLPEWLWERLRLEPPPPGPDLDRTRVELLDSREWFVS